MNFGLSVVRIVGIGSFLNWDRNMIRSFAEMFVAGLLVAIGGLLIIFGLGAMATAQITCTGYPIPDSWCNPAHAKLPALPPGPRCVEGNASCSHAQGSVCSGSTWQDAVAGICNANTGNETGDCVEDYAKTLVTVKKVFKDCKFDSQATPGSCSCRSTPQKNPDGTFVEQDLEVCNCTNV